MEGTWISGESCRLTADVVAIGVEDVVTNLYILGEGCTKTPDRLEETRFVKYYFISGLILRALWPNVYDHCSLEDQDSSCLSGLEVPA